MTQDAVDWAELEFRGTPGFNQRLQKRLVHTAAALATRPQGTLPHRFTWAELKGAYNLIHATHQPDAIQEVHRHNTRERAVAVDGPVLFIHDTTQLDFSTHTAVADQLGPIGDGADCARGFLQHNSLVVDPEANRLLGLIHQQTFLRTPKPDGETRAARYQRPNRESQVWLRGIEAVGRPPEGKMWVHVGDRGADLFAAMATARRYGTHFLIRLAQNRSARGVEADSDDVTHLMDAARGVEAVTTTTVKVASRGGRPSRVAIVQVGAIRLAIRSSKADPMWRHEPAVELTVVRIWEKDPPPDVEPLEWILGTDLLDHSPAALLRYQSWYEWRWRTMEEYHKAQKTGCRIEDLRFETAERLLTAIALYSVVAVRILQLRWQRDECPDAPAESVASAEELEVLQLVRPGKPIVTVKHFVDRVAGLGGFLGRKCDGRPGWQSLWRGYQRLADILLGYSCAKTSHSPKFKRSG
jgi:hypothetical protein